MFQQLLEILEDTGNYVSALERGFENFTKTLPMITKQQIDVFSRKKLGSTQENFMSAVTSKLVDNVLVVELDPDNWLANAVESGADPFDMKENLSSPKAKVSKEGYRYMRIPLGVSKDKKPGTEKGKEFQEKIKDVLTKPKFGIKKLKMKMDGSVQVAQKVETGGELGGLYRMQFYKDAQSLHGNKRPFKTEYILFRTMSEKPGAIGKWQHPGIKPAHIFRETEKWLENNIDNLLDSMIEMELEKAGFK